MQREIRKSKNFFTCSVPFSKQAREHKQQQKTALERRKKKIKSR